METRKLIKFGKSSFVVSLPRSWVEKQGLKKGDQVGLEIHDLGLEIVPKPNLRKRRMLKQTIEEGTLDAETVRMKTISAYLANANIIEIKGSPDLRNTVAYKEILLNLTGFEIVDITRQRIIAKDILDERAVSISRTIQRIHHIVRGQLQECVNRHTRSELLVFVERDKDINRLVYLLFRVLRYLLSNPAAMRGRTVKESDGKKRALTSLDINRDWAMTLRLEYLGDHAKRIATYLSRQKESKGHLRQLEKAHADLLRCLETTMRAYEQDKPELCYHVEKDLSSLAILLEGLMVKAKDRFFILAIASLRDAVRAVRHMGRAILNVQVLQEIDQERTSTF